MSLIFRYVDLDTVIVQEDLVSLFECDEGITGQQNIRCLQTYGLDFGKFRGHSYNGVGNMTGSIRGTAALISAQYPLALYLHCAFHALHLAVVEYLQVTSVRYMIEVIHSVSVFFLLFILKGNEL